MKKIIFIMLALFIFNGLKCATYQVSPDGTKDFTIIQHAVRVASNNDTIIVHPGTYYGDIIIENKSITLQSLYATSKDQAHITNTKLVTKDIRYVISIIDTGLQPGPDPFHVKYNVTVDGFTIHNNLNNEPFIRYNIIGGSGGIYATGVHTNIKNNIITNCFGTGISISAPAGEKQFAYLENNQIFNNWQIVGGAGLSAENSAVLIFSKENRNSIYNNRAHLGNDIFLHLFIEDCDIYLDKCSRIVKEVDWWYISCYKVNELSPHYYDPKITVDILQEALPPLRNHDLYVAPWGNDDNSGLSFDDPLKTIYFASSIIASDPENPKTIYLSAGTFARQDGQIFPVILPMWTKLVGAGMDKTILDEGNIEATIICSAPFSEFELRDFSVINSGFSYDQQSNTISGMGDKVTIENVSIINSKNQLALSIAGPGLVTNPACNKKFFGKNIIIKNSMNMPFIFSRMHVFVENIIIDHIIADPAWPVASMIYTSPNVIVNNMAITNCRSYNYSGLFFISANERAIISDEKPSAILNNVLIANNETQDLEFVPLGPLVQLSNTLSHTTLNNFTIANNKLNYRTMAISGRGAIMNNCILYNPELKTELIAFVWDEYDRIPLTINNSIIYGNRKVIDDRYDTSLNNLIYTSPEFAGQHDSSLSEGKMEYYYLHPSSPCIDSGFEDMKDMHMLASDLAGNHRIWNGRIDIGAFEYGSHSVGISDEIKPLVENFNLKSYPNPVYLRSNSATLISFDYSGKTSKEPEIEIFNIKGQKIKTIKTGMSFIELASKAGISNDNMKYVSKKNYSVMWDMKDNNNKQVASGMYFYQAKVDGNVLQTNKMVILK